MKKLSCILASLPLITTACGGGGGSDDTPPAEPFDLSLYKGTYSNDAIQTVTTSSGKPVTFSPSTTLITSDKKMAILTSDFKAFFLDPDTQTGKYFSAFTFIDNVNFSITQNNDKLVVSFSNTAREINGSLTFNSTDAYNTAGNNINLAGVWTDDNTDDYFYPNHGPWEFTILEDGSFTASNTNSCSIDGGLLTPINNTVNEFSVTMSVSSCANFNGTHTGVAYVETITSPDDRLVIITNNGDSISSRTLGIKPVRN